MVDLLEISRSTSVGLSGFSLMRASLILRFSALHKEKEIYTNVLKNTATIDVVLFTTWLMDVWNILSKWFPMTTEDHLVSSSKN